MPISFAIPIEVLDQLVANRWREKKKGERIPFHSLTFLFSVSIFYL